MPTTAAHVNMRPFYPGPSFIFLEQGVRYTQRRQGEQNVRIQWVEFIVSVFADPRQTPLVM
jgi:hypothetical protein